MQENGGPVRWRSRNPYVSYSRRAGHELWHTPWQTLDRLGKPHTSTILPRLGAAALVLLVFDTLFPWSTSAPTPASPPLETDSSEANESRLTPAGTAAPLPISVAPSAFAPCPEEMVYVAGEFCPGLSHICKRYLNEKMDRCAEFVTTSRCFGQNVPKRFCIDRYEYPNEFGKLPTLGVNWDEARLVCLSKGKRLCTADEWTLACEGEGRLPYPYGYSRDTTACNIDKPYIIPNDAALATPATEGAEMARLDQRESAGNRPACVSTYGVFDMTGNADEWVDYERGTQERAPFRSGLKGGYWGPVRNRCRPITATHNRWHHGYQIGFRCCRDPDPGAE